MKQLCLNFARDGIWGKGDVHLRRWGKIGGTFFRPWQFDSNTFLNCREYDSTSYHSPSLQNLFSSLSKRMLTDIKCKHLITEKNTFCLSVEHDPWLFWVRFASVLDWSRKLAPSFQPIKCRLETSRRFFTFVFPRREGGILKRICMEFSVAPCVVFLWYSLLSLFFFPLVSRHWIIYRFSQA